MVKHRPATGCPLTRFGREFYAAAAAVDKRVPHPVDPPAGGSRGGGRQSTDESYNPSLMAAPHKATTKPAAMWPYRSTRRNEACVSPTHATTTIAVMVDSVVTVKTNATNPTLHQLNSAAGNMRGINGSHGPKTKMVNRIHGVIEATFSSPVCT